MCRKQGHRPSSPSQAYLIPTTCKGEILGLTWDDVNFRRDQIIIRHSKNGESQVRR